MILHPPGRLSSLALTFSAFLFIQTAQGFFPTTWREVAFGYGGISHFEQTEIAFQSLAAKYFPTVDHLTKSMIKARNTIAEANALVDKNQHESALHCDGENFDGAQVRLQTLQKEVVKFLNDGNPTKARKSLGSALHTLQDFYAHSNWVELGNTSPSDTLGRSATIPHAGPLDSTCDNIVSNEAVDTNSETLDICTNCRFNTLELPLLTSGYVVGEDAIPPPGVAKCYHGDFTDGPVDSSTLFSPSDFGINKDSLYCGSSPHYFLHSQAAAVSIAATERYIDDIRELITQAQLRQLFGVGPSFAFVIDTTPIMSDVLAAVQHAGIEIVDERLGTADEPSTYIVASSNNTTTGSFITTTDVELFKSTVLRLDTTSGSDCPKLPVKGMINAINVMDEGSTLIVYTDATFQDEKLADEAILLADEKNIDVYIFKFDSGCNEDVPPRSKNTRVESTSDRVYGAISLATSGGFHSVPVSATANVTALVDTLTLSDSNFIIRIVTSFADDGSASYLIPVDSSVTRLSISLRGHGVSILISDPSGVLLDHEAVGVSNVTLTDGIFIIINSPMKGSWRAQVTGNGTFTLEASGISPLHFSSFNFATLAGRLGHAGFFPILNPPPHNADIAVIAALDGPWSTAAFSFRSPDGTHLASLSTTQGTGAAGDPPANEFFSKIRLAPTDQYVYVAGADALGFPYMRLVSSMISPVYSNDVFNLGSSPVNPPITNCTSFTSSGGKISTLVSPSTTPRVYEQHPSFMKSSYTDLGSPPHELFRRLVAGPITASGSTPPSGLSSIVSGPFANLTTKVPTASLSSAVSSVFSSPAIFGISSSASGSVNSLVLSTSTFHKASSGFSLSTASRAFSNLSTPVSSLGPVRIPSSGFSSGLPLTTVPEQSAHSTSLRSPSNLTTSSRTTASASGTSTLISTLGPSINSSSPVSLASGRILTTEPARPFANSSSSRIFHTVATTTSRITETSLSDSSTSNSLGTITSRILSGNAFISAISPGHSFYGNGTTVTYHSPALSKTSADSVNLSIPPSHTDGGSTIGDLRKGGITSVEVVITTTTDCPVTVGSTTVSGSLSFIITHSISTVTITTKSTIPCKKCKSHIYPPTSPSRVTALLTAASLTSTNNDLPPITVTEVVYVTTSTCPATISTLIRSGSTSYITTHFITTETLTSTTSELCNHCGPRTVTIRVGKVPLASPTSLPPVTITEIVYLTISTYHITIGTITSSGTMSYVTTYSITTETLTSVTTALCDKCGPKRVTLRVGSVPPAGLPTQVTASLPFVGPPGYVTPNVGYGLPSASSTNVTPLQSVGYVYPPAVPSPPECYGVGCVLPITPRPIPSSPSLYTPPAGYFQPSTPLSIVVSECSGLKCPDVASHSAYEASIFHPSAPALPSSILIFPASGSAYSTPINSHSSSIFKCEGPDCPHTSNTPLVYDSPPGVPVNPPGPATSAVPVISATSSIVVKTSAPNVLHNTPSISVQVQPPLPAGTGCIGSGCSGTSSTASLGTTNLSPTPGNTTVSIPPSTFATIYFTGGVDKSLKVIGETAALTLLFIVSVGIVML